MVGIFQIMDSRIGIATVKYDTVVEVLRQVAAGAAHNIRSRCDGCWQEWILCNQISKRPLESADPECGVVCL